MAQAKQVKTISAGGEDFADIKALRARVKELILVSPKCVAKKCAAIARMEWYQKLQTALACVEGALSQLDGDIEYVDTDDEAALARSLRTARARGST